MTWPALHPGLAPLRRSPARWQLDAGGRLVLADRPGLAAMLRLIDGSHPVTALEQRAASVGFDSSVPALLDELAALGALTASRSKRLPVELHCDGPTSLLRPLFAAAIAPDAVLDSPGREPVLTVFVHAGEPDRRTLQAATTAGRVHLPVVLDHDRAHVGPLVVPGHSACLACLDAHLARWNPAWPALLDHARPARGLSDVPALGPAIAVALAETVGDLRRFREPHVVGRRLTIGPDPRELSDFEVPISSSCGCRLLVA